MDASRRDFMKVCAAAATAAAAADPAEAATILDNGDIHWEKSVCRFCGTGCGVMLGVRSDRLVAVRGDVEHPTTKGLACAKSLFLPKIVHSPDRLKKPMLRKGDKFVEISWDEAMELMAEKFASAIKKTGPKSVAYYGSGQATSEESYLANRLFKGGIGSNHVEGNPRLCMASAVGGYVTSFGKDEPMGSYDDIDHAKVFFLVGSNTAECHPTLYDRILARKAGRRDVMVIVLDPRLNPTRSIADIYMTPKPGYDLAVFHGMAHVILRENRHDQNFIDKNVQFKVMENGKPKVVDLEGYRKFLEAFSPEKVELITGVPANSVVDAARAFATGPSMSFWTMGLNQRTRGVWANNLMHNLHLITGLIGKPGSTPFSLTGQPNACGGVRDTGSLCHVLPYGRVIKKAKHREEMEKIWGCKPGTIADKPGYHTVKMFQALEKDEIQAVLILTTNPGQSLPNASRYRKAMAKARPNKPFVVVLDIFPTLTTELADLVLPAAMWSEKSGVFGMSERRYQYHPKVVSAPGEARPDYEILLDFAARLEKLGVVPKGYVTDKLHNIDDIWEEMMVASKDTAYDFRGITRERLKKERGVRWPAPTVDHPGTSRRFVKGDDPLLDSGPYADNSVQKGEMKFYAAPNHRATVWLRPLVGPAEEPDKEYPFSLSTGRVLEHWHTGTMTMKARELRQAYPKSFMEINPRDAKKLCIANGDKIKITSRRGSAISTAYIIDQPQDGTVFVPFCWDDHESQINRVTIDAFDAGSKQPEYKMCAVKLEKV